MKFIGLIGCGYWGKNIIRDFNKLGALHTLCDINETLLFSYKDKYPELNYTTSWNDMLQNPEITAICVSLPASLHYQFCKDALQNNKDVYVEKPIALSLDHANELVKIAKKNNKILMVGHLLQYHPCVTKIYEMIKDNKIGQIRYITSNRLNLGKIRQEENVLWSFAPHDISVIIKLMNDQLPKSVICNGQDFVSSNIHDITTTIMEFPNNCYAHIYVNWLNPFKEQKLTIVGTDGMIIFEDTAEKKLTYFGKYMEWNNETPEIIKSKGINIDYESKSPLELECNHFIHCCKTRTTPLTDGEEGCRVLAVLDAAQRSLNNQNMKIYLSNKNYFIHNTSFIDQGAIIGNNTKIWHFSHIMKSKIGNNCNIGQNVFIGDGVILGNNVKVQNNVSIYTGIICEDDVFFGPSCVLTNDLNPRCKYPKNKKYVKTIIKKGVSIGANATILCGITLGENAFIGAGAVVIRDVPPNAVMVGNPARNISSMDEQGNITKD